MTVGEGREYKPPCREWGCREKTMSGGPQNQVFSNKKLRTGLLALLLGARTLRTGLLAWLLGAILLLVTRSY